MKNKVWKQIFFSIICTSMMLCICFLSGCIGTDQTNQIRIIETGKNFDSIQQAVTQAENGATIFIPSGKYHESVIIDKPLSLIGENKHSTIIEGEDFDYVFSLLANNISISDMTLSNTGKNWTESNKKASIIIRSEYNKIDYIEFSMNKNYGITLRNAHNNSIENCEFRDNGEGGVYSYYSNNNTFINNTFQNNSKGFFLYFNHGGLLKYNTMSAHSLDGIYLYASRYLDVEDNTFTSNEKGIHIKGSKNNTLKNNLFVGNTIGVYMCCSGENNLIFRNVFMNNDQHAKGYPINQFDNGQVGNYWDDYEGVDTNGDGIGDKAYNVTEGVYGQKNIDHFPLVE